MTKIYRTQRQQARERNESTFVSKPCRECDNVTRYVETNRCTWCSTPRLSERQAARQRGDTFYQGAPCKHGHSGRRYVSKGQCADCQAETSARRPNGPEQREQRRLWRIANPDRRGKARTEHDRRRTERKRETSDGSVTAASLTNLMLQQRGLCAYCISPAEHLDHMVPLVRGGAHSISNAQWLCAPCNIDKGRMTDAEYRAHRAIL